MSEIEDRERSLAAGERALEEAAEDAVRQFLRRVLREVRPEALTAATSPQNPIDLFTLGEAHEWWEAAVAEHVTDAVRAVWRRGYLDTLPPGTTTSLAGVDVYLANVTDRLSRTATPTIPAQAMDIARTAITEGVAAGDGIREISRRLAAEFSWDNPATYWREQKAEIDQALDVILDSYGPKGHPAREAVRTGRTPDPTVTKLQDQAAQATRRIDRVESTWQVRAERIARTETTGAYNAGTQQAAIDLGLGWKAWSSTIDDRTRLSHLQAHGQCVPYDAQFEVGGNLLMMPGSPEGAVEEVVNCRCVMMVGRTCDQLERTLADNTEAIAREIVRREEGG